MRKVFARAPQLFEQRRRDRRDESQEPPYSRSRLTLAENHSAPRRPSEGWVRTDEFYEYHLRFMGGTGFANPSPWRGSFLKVTELVPPGLVPAERGRARRLLADHRRLSPDLHGLNAFTGTNNVNDDQARGTLMAGVTGVAGNNRKGRPRRDANGMCLKDPHRDESPTEGVDVARQVGRGRRHTRAPFSVGKRQPPCHGANANRSRWLRGRRAPRWKVPG